MYIHVHVHNIIYNVCVCVYYMSFSVTLAWMFKYGMHVYIIYCKIVSWDDYMYMYVCTLYVKRHPCTHVHVYISEVAIGTQTT